MAVKYLVIVTISRVVAQSTLTSAVVKQLLVLLREVVLLVICPILLFRTSVN